MLAPGDERVAAEFAALWPLKRFPVLVDEGRTVVEASIIIEHLGLHHPGPVRLVPADPRAALDARMMDRFFDNYVSTPLQKIVLDSIRAAEDRDRRGVAEARTMLDTAYCWLDGRMTGRTWAAGDAFSLADCAAAPALFYADWAHPIVTEFGNVHAYRRRLLARPSYARAVDEARPYRQLFPLGAPDRD
jgi:glutathione S-transferase